MSVQMGAFEGSQEASHDAKMGLLSVYLTVLETLTPQGFFIRAFGLSVRKEQEALLLRAVSGQSLGWLFSP